MSIDRIIEVLKSGTMSIYLIDNEGRIAVNPFDASKGDRAFDDLITLRPTDKHREEIIHINPNYIVKIIPYAKDTITKRRI